VKRAGASQLSAGVALRLARGVVPVMPPEAPAIRFCLDMLKKASDDPRALAIAPVS